MSSTVMKPKKGMDKEEAFRSGYVALIGLPNVGKSTLMNRILGEKISIVTDKPQTTRNRILGVKTTEKYQIIFLDTPGIHRPKHRLNEIMMKTSFATLEDADLILFLVDPKKKIGEGEHFVLQKLKQVKRAVILVINKIDLVNKEELLPMIDGYKNLMEIRRSFLSRH